MRPVAQIAQSVEQRIENPRVRGSIPRLGTMITKASQQCEAFSFLLSDSQRTVSLYFSISRYSVTRDTPS